ncbi:hypothetical protein [Streptococcus suis]
MLVSTNLLERYAFDMVHVNSALWKNMAELLTTIHYWYNWM